LIPAIGKKKISQKEAMLNQQLLDVVDRQGAVSEPHKMIKLLELMSEAKSADAQSLLLNVVAFSRRPDIKKTFIDNNGLTILKEWLIQAIKGRNSQLVRQELKVIYTLPITVDTLSKSGMGRLVKKLEGHSNDVVKKWATRIMNNWKEVVLNASKKAESSPTRPEKKENEVRGVKRAREPTPAAGTTKQPLKISESGEFDNLVSGPANPKALGVEKRKLQGLIPDHVKRRRHAVQLIEEDLTLPHPIAKGANSYKPKPLSADDIKKAKGSSTKAATAPILSPPLSTTKQVEIGKRQREEGKEANLGGEAMEVIHEEEAPQPSKKRKRVSWAPEDKLTTVKTFEKYLPSLMGNTSRPSGSFQALMQLEKQHERQMAEQQRKHEEEEWKENLENMTPAVPWKAPQLLFMSPECKVAMGENSKEVDIQRQRQSKILGEYYSRDEDIPPTPAEPAEPQEDYDDTSIPLDDTQKPPPRQKQILPPSQQHPQQHPPPQQRPQMASTSSFGAPTLSPSVLSGTGQFMLNIPLPGVGGKGNVEQGFSALLADQQTLDSLAHNPALSSLLAGVSAPLMGSNLNIKLPQQQPPPSMGMGRPMSGGMIYNPSQPSVSLPPQGMQQQQHSYFPPQRSEHQHHQQQNPYPGPPGHVGPQGMHHPPYGPAGSMPSYSGGPPPGQYPQRGGYGGGYPGGGRGNNHGAGEGGPPIWGKNDWKRDKLCSFFNSPQGCRNGEACPFQHVVGASAKLPHERREERERRH